jgi:glycosyltransferase involved in cell wall biosynthesis
MEKAGQGERRVLHIMRLPMGGLFRHVRDLVIGQREEGIEVGVVSAAPPDDGISAERLALLERHCSLGLHLLSMPRLPGLGDVVNIRHVGALAHRLKPNVLHGHGAKGGLLARLAPAPHDTLRVYTPHGGSLHYEATSLQGFAYLTAERAMRARTHGVIFESAFSQKAYLAKVGEAKGVTAVIHNGVSDEEFALVERADDAADFLFIGELRMLKGVSTLIEAATLLARCVHIRIVGAGPDRARFEEMAKAAGDHVRIEFLGAMPAREAFKLAKIAVMPSWNESLPYVALEAAAAGVPLIATDVGGIPEIFGPLSAHLVPPRDAAALAGAMEAALTDLDATRTIAMRLRSRVAEHFSASRMVAEIDVFYTKLAARGRGLSDAALLMGDDARLTKVGR